MRDFFVELHRRNRVLSAVGWFHVGLLVITFGVACFDHRTILGINPWIKPMKFMASIAIFLWTLAWLMAYLPGPRWAVRTITWGVSVTWLVQITCISLQSARGTTSSYNYSPVFNHFIYDVMAFMIVFTALFVALLLMLFLVEKVQLDPAYHWGICLGIIVLLIGSAQGVMMHYNLGHTVGAPDGGPGLPLMNWSTKAGDLRIGHMVCIHGLQILPLFGFLVSRWMKGEPPARRIGLVATFSVFYLAIVLITTIQAASGRPLIRRPPKPTASGGLVMELAGPSPVALKPSQGQSPAIGPPTRALWAGWAR